MKIALIKDSMQFFMLSVIVKILIAHFKLTVLRTISWQDLDKNGILWFGLRMHYHMNMIIMVVVFYCISTVLILEII